MSRLHEVGEWIESALPGLLADEQGRTPFMYGSRISRRVAD